MTNSADKSIDQPLWELSVHLKKDTFLFREPIWLDVKLTNVSNDTIRFWSLHPCQGLGLDIVLANGNGDTIPYSGPQFDFMLKEGTILHHDDEVYDTYDLIELFAVKYTNTIYFGGLPPDEYNVQAFYGDVASNKIGLAVINPTGADKETEHMLLDALSYSFRKNSDSLIASLQKVLELYPNSVYAEIPGLRVLSIEEFLERFPNSGNTGLALQDHIDGLSANAKKLYLENVIAKYQGTRAARHAEQLLKRQRKLTREK